MMLCKTLIADKGFCHLHLKGGFVHTRPVEVSGDGRIDLRLQPEPLVIIVPLIDKQVNEANACFTLSSIKHCFHFSPREHYKFSLFLVC